MEQNPLIVYSKKMYSEELKRQICQEHINFGTSLRALKRKYDLSSHSLIHSWLRELGFIKSDLIAEKKTLYIGVDNFNNMPLKVKKETINSSSLPTDNTIISQLKKELEEAKLLAEAYKRVIEIAETDLKIPIRKKYNTK